MDGGGYNSDEEVYAVARAIDAEEEVSPALIIAG